jgi:TRAP-type C4-dicarboxylate transport system permease small subunit
MGKGVIQVSSTREPDCQAQWAEDRTGAKPAEQGSSLRGVYVSTPFLRIDAVLRWLCRVFAGTGGIILTALTLITVGTVLGRAFLNTPIPGDFELVELGAAIAVSSFLPYCQIQEGNVIVDLVTSKAPERVKRFLGALGDLLLMLISALIAWRLVMGCIDYRDYGDVTMVLRVPIWMAMLPVIASFALLAITCASTMMTNFFAVWRPENSR